ncbi:MAG: extracellular solute-binding protein [Anaerolineaceae bacterium]
MEKYPNYEVEYTPFSYGDLQQKIQTAIPIGQGCDILENWGDEMYGMINSGLIAPMDDTLATTIKNNFWEGSYTSLLHSGKLYGFCQEIAFDNGLLINKKDYAAANLTKYPETTAELFEQAKALTQVDAQGVITRAGLGWMYHDQTLANFCEGVVELGGNYWNSDQTQVTFQTPEAAAVLNTMFDMVNGQKISSVEIDSGTREDLLYQDKVALQKIGPWIMPTSQANYPDVGVDWIVGPGFTGKPRQAVNTGGWSIFVTTQSAGKPGIWDFVGFKASEDVQRDFISRTGLVPAMKVLKDDPAVIEKQPQLKNVMPLVGKTFSMGPVFNASKFTLAVYNNFIPFLNKEKDVTAALAGAEKEINTMLAEANK